MAVSPHHFLVAKSMFVEIVSQVAQKLKFFLTENSKKSIIFFNCNKKQNFIFWTIDFLNFCVVLEEYIVMPLIWLVLPIPLLAL